MSDFQLQGRVGIRSVHFQNVKIKPGDSVYFMGICGTAMASFAVYLKSIGFQVFGSDDSIYPPMSSLLEKEGISVHPYNKKNLHSKIKLVFVGNVIRKINKEVEVLEDLKIPYTSLPEFLEQTLLKETKNIVVAGTHGKSTTTSLAIQAARFAEQNPSYFVGALSDHFQQSFHVTQKKYFIIEGDEYDTAFFAKHSKFFYYHPSVLILTSVEFDHADIYNDFEEVKMAFKKLIQKMPKDSLIIACAESETVKDLISFAQCKVLTYGVKSGDYKIKNRKILNDMQEFDIFYGEEKIDKCHLKLLGEHNALNALSIFAMSHCLEWPKKLVLDSLKHFEGLERRLQEIGEFNGVLLYEDFAHHPTAVKVTLSALKEKFPDKRLVVLFEPRSFTSRINIFQKDYEDSFDLADIIFIAKPYNSLNIDENKKFSSEKLVKSLEQKNKQAFCEEDILSIKKQCLSLVQKGDVVLVMSNGSFGGILQDLKREL